MKIVDYFEIIALFALYMIASFMVAIVHLVKLLISEVRQIKHARSIRNHEGEELPEEDR